MQEKDYTNRVLYTLVIVAVIMVGLIFIPSHTFGGISIKRANIVSDLIHFEDENFDKYKLKNKTDLALDTTFIQDIPSQINEEINDINDGIKTTKEVQTPQLTSFLSFIPIEDYSADSMMLKFYRKLQEDAKKRIVRIAVCGDSFIESDILTSDVREMLQNTYGGRGVGFVPFSHPLLKYRSTISSSSIGWIDYSVMKKKMIPAEYKQSMYISGNISIPVEESSRCYFKGNSNKKFLDYAERISILFKNTQPTDITVTINDSEERIFNLESKEEVQCITLEEKVTSLSISVSKPEGFIGYGICFDGKNGVAVDNYSIRGNSGLALFTSNFDVNSEINSYLKYDLIILQYGLNVMVENNLDYSIYKGHLKKLISYMKLCFPNSAIIVMGVSDRGTRVSGSMKTMNSVLPMITEQHLAAMESGVAFWNTFNAMGGKNSIIRFVEKGYAGKDYTHINHRGGKVIADEILASISNEIERIPKRETVSIINKMQVTYPDQITYKSDIDLQTIVKADNTKHRFISRKYWRYMRRW